ncbi:HNH endonuclease signature motif containing protein [Pseudomonas sp. C32]|uniref:HNH endonuclease n=1 Tax=Pseudomonas sp. C32 TaxID=1529208 RepID=UPI00262D0150|nr:HNH endonuclease signature motif containing protein [Pseudomonas sp. C32]MDN4546389.1 HNH endonuclease signature motif containing protein [Pseudomonas sp. C32]
MAYEFFQDKETEYQNWIASNPNGFVLTTTKNISISYMVLHRATCRTISQYMSNMAKGAFTGKRYIKICSNNPGDLSDWVETQGGAGFTTLCSKCSPNIFLSVASEPVLCMSPDDLERESDRLFHENFHRVPAGQDSPARLARATEQFVRDAQVVAFVLRKASGKCECCRQPAPFEKPNGLPYLEVHHVKRLASGGSDKTTNAVALCPNCHRELHHGANATELAERLYSRVERLVRE